MVSAASWREGGDELTSHATIGESPESAAGSEIWDTDEEFEIEKIVSSMRKKRKQKKIGGDGERAKAGEKRGRSS